MSMAECDLEYICPKRKCRHQWEAVHSWARPADCPKCGAKKIEPIVINRRAA